MSPTLATNGYELIPAVYSEKEVNDMLTIIKTKRLDKQFGVREFLLDNLELKDKIFTDNLKNIIHRIAPNCTKSIKSIYFDKPPNANWIVSWHQDLTINLKKKKETSGFKNWRVKPERVVVQPTQKILENIFTIRIHLDDCTKQNGALRVIDNSHQKGVIDIKEWIKEKVGHEQICEVKKGGIMLMKPLLLHASKRTENQKNRRVIHIEFTDQELPNGLEWKEKIKF